MNILLRMKEQLKEFITFNGNNITLKNIKEEELLDKIDEINEEKKEILVENNGD